MSRRKRHQSSSSTSAKRQRTNTFWDIVLQSSHHCETLDGKGADQLQRSPSMLSRKQVIELFEAEAIHTKIERRLCYKKQE